jgi:hypothetical protein
MMSKTFWLGIIRRAVVVLLWTQTGNSLGLGLGGQAIEDSNWGSCLDLGNEPGEEPGNLDLDLGELLGVGADWVMMSKTNLAGDCPSGGHGFAWTRTGNSL